MPAPGQDPPAGDTTPAPTIPPPTIPPRTVPLPAVPAPTIPAPERPDAKAPETFPPDAPASAPAPADARPDADAVSHVLRLYVAGTTARSTRAVATARRLLEARLPGRYALAVVDIYQDPEAARVHQIVAVPTLIRLRPLPLRRLIGDLSDEARVLAALGLDPAP